MSDPVAAAATQIAAAAASAEPSSTEPPILTEIIEEFKHLGEKVEHLIHPEHSAEVAQPRESSSASSHEASDQTLGQSTGDAQSAPSESPTSTNTENSQTAISVTMDTTSEAEWDKAPNGIVGVVAEAAESSASVVSHVATSAASGIRMRIAAIKRHLMGFEESSRQKIHAELDAIERFL